MGLYRLGSRLAPTEVIKAPRTSFAPVHEFAKDNRDNSLPVEFGRYRGITDFGKRPLSRLTDA